MTHQYTKLADDLEVIRQSFREMSHADRNPNWFTDGPRAATAHRLMWQRKGLEVADSIDEAASILRAAASVDVAGLMELAAKAIYDQWADQLGWVEWVPGGNSLNQDEARSIARAALESALRMALAGREEWQPIETAPKDVAVLLWGKYWNNKDVFQRPLVGQWNPISNPQRWEALGEYRFGIRPTHWMPLPAAPKGTP